MEGNTTTLNLTLPEQSLASLSFCEATPKALKDWVTALPMANIGETSRCLYNAVIELNQLELPAQQRLSLMELIRQPIYYICNELARHFLGHSITLPEKQRKVANLAQALQLHLSQGYKQALTDLLLQNNVDRNKRLIARCCHRAITDLSSTVLRAAQLYCPSPAHSWIESHRIFRFALQKRLADIGIEDDTSLHRGESTVAEAYKRLLLMGCCRSNQLRQNELSQVYGLFENWTQYTDFSAGQITDALFVVNTERDGPPVYRSLLNEPITSHFYGFDTTELSFRLTETLGHLREKQSSEPSLLDMPVAVSESLLLHLSQALGILTKRSFKRLSSSGQLHVCVGMSAVHYYSADKVDFNSFLSAVEPHSDDENVFLSSARRKEDAWAGVHDAGPAESMVSPDTPINFRGASGNVMDGQERASHFPSYRVPLVNTSPGGYCLHWNTVVPTALQAGEILGVREQENHPWSLAVIRWIRQVRQHGTQVGVELLAPNASPCGVRLIQKVGNSSEYLRGLLLPELGSIGQPATLITPRLPFQTGSRVVLYHDHSERQGQLSRRVSATGSISQFELRFLGRPEPEAASTPDRTTSGREDDFDSLWPSL